MKGKKIIAAVLAVSMLSGTALSLAACGKNKGGAYEYEIWISGNENTKYTKYNDNLAVKYWNTLEFKGEDGELHDTHVEFITASSTDAAKDEFNNMMSMGNFYDVMDLAQSSYTASELYQDGMLMDLTPYMEECMPNYLAWLKANPEYGNLAADYIDGEKKYVQLYSFHDLDEQWGGWQYRRDWIAKYGKDKDGKAFTYSYDENGVMTDNIVFPSYYNEELRNSYNALLKKNGLKEWDGTDPAFISDWEWMLDIFKTALTEKGVAKGNSQTGETGYPMSIYYPGFIETGDLICAYGGGSADFYPDTNGKIQYGLTGDNFKVYLQAMQQWYKNGWIDSVFNTRSSDMHYQVDTDKLYQGRIGLFYGNGNTPINRLAKKGDKFLEGYYVGSARQPINDVHGADGDPAKYVPGTNEFLPRVFFSNGKVYSSIGLTVKLEKDGKDVKALLRMIDHLYQYDYKDENGVLQPGGSMLCNGGLTKAQYDTVASGDDYYAKTIINGKPLSETGAIVLNSASTAYEFVPGLGGNDNARNPSFINRFVGLQQNVNKGRTDFEQKTYDEWGFYTSARLQKMFTGQLSIENTNKYNALLDNVRQDTKTSVPGLIMGATFDETKYSQIMYQVGRRGVADMVTAMQELYDRFYK